MASYFILLPIIVPVLTALALIVTPKKLPRAKDIVALAGTFINLLIAIALFKKNIYYSVPWCGFGMDLSFKLYQFSAFITLAAAGFAFLVTLYSSASLAAKDYAKQFYVYLAITLCMVNGAVLADNLVLMLFFWEGLLLTLFAMIAIGNKDAFKTATKAFVIVGISDVCMMVGIALTAYLAGTLTISQINIPMAGLGGIAFILLMIGAISKAGSMPFHSWIPDAAIDAPLPFMAMLPFRLCMISGAMWWHCTSLKPVKRWWKWLIGS